MHIHAALAEFETQLVADGRSPHTVAQYRRHIRLLERWMVESGVGPFIGQLTPQVIARFLASPLVQKRNDGAPRKPGSANAIRASVRGFGDYLDRAEHLTVNPARLVRRARCGAPKPRGMSAADKVRFLDALRAGKGREAKRDRVLFEFLLGTGTRLGAALLVDVSDVSTDGLSVVLRHEKGSLERSVGANPELGRLLVEHVEPLGHGPVFCTKPGVRMSQRQAQRRFRGVVQRAAIRGRWSPHTLRHTFATDLLEQTRDLMLVRNALGHRSISSTLAYTWGASTHRNSAKSGACH